jgi:hypothetical protein
VKCSEIPELPILEFLSKNTGTPVTWFDVDNMPTVKSVMPEKTPPNLRLAKMRQLLKRGLVCGCGCGCRGDFEITEAGGALLASAGVPARHGVAVVAQDLSSPD